MDSLYGVCFCAESKRERLVNNLQNLSVGDRVRMLKAIPLSLAEKSELRLTVFCWFFLVFYEQNACFILGRFYGQHCLKHIHRSSMYTDNIVS